MRCPTNLGLKLNTFVHFNLTTNLSMHQNYRMMMEFVKNSLLRFLIIILENKVLYYHQLLNCLMITQLILLLLLRMVKSFIHHLLSNISISLYDQRYLSR